MNRIAATLRDMPFRRKLFLSYVVVALIPLIILGTYAYSQARDQLVHQQRAERVQQVERSALALDYRFAKYNSIAEFIALNPRIIEIFSTHYTDPYDLYTDVSGVVVPLLRTVQGADSDIQDLFIATTNDLPNLSGTIRRMESLSTESWIELPMNNSSTSWYEDHGELIGIRQLIEPLGSDIRNVFYMRIDLDSVIGADDSGSFVWLTDSQGHVIQRQGANLLVDPSAVPAGTEQNISIGGTDYLRFTGEVPAAGWTLTEVMPVERVVVDAAPILVATIALALACLLVLVVSVWAFSGAFIRPIKALNDRVQQVTAGDLSVRITSDARDEIGELTNGFSRMVESIKNLMDDVVDQRTKNQNAEIRMLQAQIKPHFLHNTLSLINWTAIELGSTKISELTVSLSRYYRTMLANNRSRVAIEDEIANVRAYVSIQQQSHDRELDVQFDVEPGTERLLISSFLIQPIVENAIEYGVFGRRDNRGFVKVTVRRDAASLLIQVEDNGPGFGSGRAEEVLAAHYDGHGVRNVAERIRLLYGDGHGLTIGPRRGGGTSVVLSLPAADNSHEGDR